MKITFDEVFMILFILTVLGYYTYKPRDSEVISSRCCSIAIDRVSFTITYASEGDTIRSRVGKNKDTEQEIINRLQDYCNTNHH